LPVLATVLIIMVGKSVASFAIVRMFKYSTTTALTISASLAQIGEFSFILAAMGVALHILPEEGRDLILAGAMISIILNPLMFFLADRLRPLLETRLVQRRVEPATSAVSPGAVEPSLEPTLTGESTVIDEPAAAAAAVETGDEPVQTELSGHTILVGFGRVGSVIGEGFKADGEPFLVIEDSDARVAEARALGIEVVVGNAASPEVLALANVEGARRLVIAMRNSFEAGQATEQCRKLNPAIDIVVRAHSQEEREYLMRMGANTVLMGEREIGLGMLAFLEGRRPQEAGTAEPAEPEASPKLAPAENFITKAIEPTLTASPAAAPAAVAVTEETLVDLPVEPVETGSPAPVVEVAAAQDGPASPVVPAVAEPSEDHVPAPPEVIALPDRSEPAAAVVEGDPAPPEAPVPPAEPGPAPEPAPTPEPSPAPEPEPQPQPVPEPPSVPEPAPKPAEPVEVPAPSPHEIPPGPSEVPQGPPPESEPSPAEVPASDPSPQELPGNSPAEMSGEPEADEPETGVEPARPREDG